MTNQSDAQESSNALPKQEHCKPPSEPAKPLDDTGSARGHPLRNEKFPGRSIAANVPQMMSRVARTWGVSCAVALFVMGCGTHALPTPKPPGHTPEPVQVATPVPSVPPPLGRCDVARDVEPLPPMPFFQATEPSRAQMSTAIQVLTDPTLRGRAAGSPENRRVSRWIADQFATYGLPPPPETNHCVPFERSGIQDQNVVAHLHSKGDANGPVFLIGAHYDAQGQKDADVYPGADDNASGVAALLEIARISALRKTGPEMVFVAFGAEERGLLGAKAYVAAPSIPLSRIRLMINLDMVGRPMLDGSPLRLLIPRADETIGFVIGPTDKPTTDDILQRAAEREDRPILGIPEVVLTRLGFASDSVPFSPHMPTIFLSTGDHADYHQPTDTQEKIDFDQITRAVRLTLAIVDETMSRKTPVMPK